MSDPKPEPEVFDEDAPLPVSTDLTAAPFINDRRQDDYEEEP